MSVEDKVANIDALLAEDSNAPSKYVAVVFIEAWRTWLREAALHSDQFDRLTKLMAEDHSRTIGELVDAWNNAAMISKGRQDGGLPRMCEDGVPLKVERQTDRQTLAHTESHSREESGTGSNPAPASPAGTDTRPCTCHPDDNPPVPCPRKYALTECRKAAGTFADGVEAKLVQTLLEIAQNEWDEAPSGEGLLCGLNAVGDFLHSPEVADALRRALSPAPEGWVMVPLDPTPAMIEALEAYYRKWQNIVSSSDDYVKAQCWSALHAYRAMLSAAQPPAATEGEGK